MVGLYTEFIFVFNFSVVVRKYSLENSFGFETSMKIILLSIETGFSLVNAAVVCAILESSSGLEPSSVITEPRYLKLVIVLSFCPFTLISVLMPLVLFVISLVFLALCGSFVKTLN